MKNIIIKTGSPLRILFPLIHKWRAWAWKFHNRTGIRLVVSGGKIKFMDAELNFPENVGRHEATALFWNGPDAYEEATSRTIALLAGKSKLFLDIGSNVGIYAVYIGVKFPSVKTIAFEPVPVIWEKNRAFHRANNLSDQIPLNLALSDFDSMQKMFLPVYDTAIEEDQTATLNEKSWQAHEKKVTVFEIQCQALDTFATKTSLPAGLCCLKIDVEGFEDHVLRGGKKFIMERRPWIVCEILPCEDYDVTTRTKSNNNRPTLAEIAAIGYVPFAITADGYFRMNPADFARPRQLKDFLLIPREKVPTDALYLARETIGELFVV